MVKNVYFYTSSGWTILARLWFERLGYVVVKNIREATLIIVEATPSTLDQALVKRYRGKTVVICPSDLGPDVFGEFYTLVVFDLGAVDCSMAHDNEVSFRAAAKDWV